MKLADSRYIRIGSEWLFDSQERVGYKVTKVSQQHGTRTRAVGEVESIQTKLAFDLKTPGEPKRHIPVPVGVIRKAEDVLKRQEAERDKHARAGGTT